MSKTASYFNALLSDIARSNARFAKRQARDDVALLDVLMSDDDMIESLNLRDALSREQAAHSH